MIYSKNKAFRDTSHHQVICTKKFFLEKESKISKATINICFFYKTTLVNNETVCRLSLF